ncbi:iron hydrogenase small subunit [Rhodomicrobium lacus]|jgi:ferredoxin hydrogenase small subunit|uniref:iron hydrogenase small subunit n=1 Tax=Rhodomicrobium lacus TaxID=2498452 RepID=UPI0026E334AA|nr:iron hydrogenase small subunit [Rhodomicrobium lacus]WKW50410.1 iron hydrogenase small subunit [Rhodomicrobium lacus]
MGKLPYDYIERPDLLSRRGFLKAAGVVVAAVAIASYTITDLILKRNKYIRLRQLGLVRDDARLQKQSKLMAFCHHNPTLKQCYADMNAKPVEGVMRELMHTSYVSRTSFAPSGPLKPRDWKNWAEVKDIIGTGELRHG